MSSITVVAFCGLHRPPDFREGHWTPDFTLCYTNRQMVDVAQLAECLVVA
jgi:hypothetical protein